MFELLWLDEVYVGVREMGQYRGQYSIGTPRHAPTLVFRAEVDKIEFPIKAEGRKSNSMQPIFVMTNDRIRGESEAAPWSVAYYFFGL